METQIYLAPVPKRNQYFQEIPIILNSFHSKHLHKLSFPHSHSKKPMQVPFPRRLSDLSLPKIRPDPSPLNFTNSKKIHFLVQGARKTTRTKFLKNGAVPLGRKNEKLPMKEIAMGTEFDAEFEDEF